MSALRQELFASSRSSQMKCFIMSGPMKALAAPSLLGGARTFSSSAKTALLREEEVVQELPAEPKPFTSIPRHKGLPLIGSSWEYLLKYKHKRHVVPGHREKVYGKIFLERISPVFPAMLTVLDPKDIETVLRADGKTPNRPGIPAIDDARKAAGLELGVLFSQGEEWLAQRKPMSQYLMVPKGVNQYSKDFNAIARDLVERVRKEAGEKGELVDTEGLLFKWSFESVHQFVLGKRPGLLGDTPPPESLQLIKDVDVMFKVVEKFIFALPLYKLYPTKDWKILLRAQEGIVREMAKSIKQRMEEIDGIAVEELESLEQFDFLTFMLTKSGMTMKTLLQNTMDLLQAGIDTTSQSLLFTLYCLATNPEVQHQLRRDIQKVVGRSADVTTTHIHELPLLRNCIKEAQRLYPIAPFIIRMLNEDVVLSGYKVPAGTFVMIPVCQTARSADYFKNPDEYNPDRWQGEESKQLNQFAFIPFGFGTRMCIGRRVAELEMRTTLAHLIRDFDVKYLDHEPMETVVHSLLSAAKPVRLGLTDHTH